jgi:3-mercaptopyruvate sulfurtransferase SseA
VEAEQAIRRFGEQARADGYAHAEAMVSVAELAKALGAPSLVVLDVRPADRFELGHIPGARRLERGDYSSGDQVPGLSRTPAELEQLLRGRGVQKGSTVVLYGDGGPEPYRLWWTLRLVANFDTRVLDGGGSSCGWRRWLGGRRGRCRPGRASIASHPALAGSFSLHLAAPRRAAARHAQRDRVRR